MTTTLKMYQVETIERTERRTAIWPDNESARLDTLDAANERLKAYCEQARRGENIEGMPPRRTTHLFVTEVQIDPNEERFGWDVRSTKDIRHEVVERVAAAA